MGINNKGEYDAWLHWSVSERCVMGCEYCRSSGGNHESRRKAPVSTIHIAKLLETLDKTGKIFRISFTGGGEPFLVPNLAEACVAVTRKHYLSLNTNLVEPQVTTFLERIDPTRILYIDASCHIKALERRKLLEKYIRHFLICKEKGMNPSAVVVSYPPLADDVEHYRALFQTHGIELQFGPFIGEYNGKYYPDAYTDDELERFDLAMTTSSPHYPNSKGYIHYCNAGYNVALVHPNGNVTPCDGIRESIGHIYETIEFASRPVRCPVEFCQCTLYNQDYELFEHAIMSNLWYIRWKKLKEIVATRLAMRQP